jgi:hypothetical protein
VLEDIADIRTAQTGVDRNQNAARSWHGKVCLQHSQGVRAQERHPVIFLQPFVPQSVGQAIHPFFELTVGVATLAMHNRRLIGIEIGAAPQKAYRR